VDELSIFSAGEEANCEGIVLVLGPAGPSTNTTL
jgi:hypothetical protein